MLTSSLLVICVVSSLLFILFNSDALPEYLRLFRLNKLIPRLLIDEYFKQLKGLTFIENYFEFLGNKYWNVFIIRLIVCPVCLSLWLSIVFSIIFIHWWLFPIIYVFSLLFYFILNILSKK